MNPSTNARSGREKLIWLVIIFVILGSMYIVATAYLDRINTGVLDIVASKDAALISVSSTGSQASVLGTGSASVRLKPGTYRVVATTTDREAIKIVKVCKQQRSSLRLLLEPSARVPSVDNIEFEGLNSLVDAGLSVSQVNYVHDGLGAFAPSAKKISIISSSVQPGPHDPNSSDPNFSLNFTVVVDGKNYRASAYYTDLENIHLVVSSSDGALLYDSAKPTAASAPND
jgi:hypothetical protein